MEKMKTVFWNELESYQQEIILYSKQYEIAADILSDISADGIVNGIDCIGEIRRVASLVNDIDGGVDEAAQLLLDADFSPITSLAIKQMSRLCAEDGRYRIVCGVVIGSDDTCGTKTGKGNGPFCDEPSSREPNPRIRPFRRLN